MKGPQVYGFNCLTEASETIKPPHPWTIPLRNVRRQVGHDGVERIATDAVFEHLDLPLKRTPEAAKRLKVLMVDLGWTPVRSRHVTSRRRAARVRGYARMRKGSNRGLGHDTIGWLPAEVTSRAMLWGRRGKPSDHSTVTSRGNFWLDGSIGTGEMSASWELNRP